MTEDIPFVNNCQDENSRDKVMDAIFIDETAVGCPNCKSFLCTISQLKESSEAILKDWLYNDTRYCHFCGQRVNLFNIKDCTDNMKEEEGDW